MVMFRGLLRNMAISAIAFAAVSIVGLLLVPILIRQYGLAGLGQIALARLFVPTAALGALDLGFGEVSTQAVASARADGDFARAGRVIALALVAAVTVGALVAGLLAGLSDRLPGWMGVASHDAPRLGRVLAMTAATLPALFASLVLEGVLKGYERYGIQRTIEVVASLAYAGATLGAVAQGLTFDWVCYALLASYLLRFAIALVAATMALRRDGARLSRWDSTDWADCTLRARALFASKVLGSAQANAPSLLIGFLLGPSAVGTFDALSRMPRFAKAVIGLLNSTVLPVAARIERLADGQSMARLGRVGLLLVALVTLPVLGTAMAFSEPVLRLWLGASFAPLWPWQAAMFLVPALGAMVSFGSTALTVRPSALWSMNRIVAIQLALQLALSLAGLRWLDERAFVLGQVAAAVLGFGLQMRLISAEMGVDASTHRRILRTTLIVLLGALPAAMLAPRLASPAVLLVALSAWPLACWTASVWLVLGGDERRALLSAVAPGRNRH